MPCLSSTERRRALLRVSVLGVLVLLGSGATCEQQDYLQQQVVTLDDAKVLESSAIVLVHPYRGINTIDYSLTNTGTQPARFGLVLELCMTCDIVDDCTTDQDACESWGRCQSGDTWCQSDAVCGEDPEVVEASDVCSLMDPQVCRLEGRNGPCAEVFVVTDLVDPGDSILSRVNQSELGVGDRLHVELICFAQCTDETQCGGGTCSASSGTCEGDDRFTCSANLEVSVSLKQLECRDDTDCDSDKVCDFQLGICKSTEGEQSGCAVAHRSTSTTNWVPLIVLCIVGCSRRRRMAGSDSLR